MSDLNYFNSESNSYSSGYYSMKYVVQSPRYDKNHQTQQKYRYSIEKTPSFD